MPGSRRSGSVLLNIDPIRVNSSLPKATQALSSDASLVVSVRPIEDERPPPREVDLPREEPLPPLEEFPAGQEGCAERLRLVTSEGKQAKRERSVVSTVWEAKPTNQ